MQSTNPKRTPLRYIETIAYVFIWLVVFIIPVLTNRLYGKIQWDQVIETWILTAAFLVVFIVNIYFLIPFYLQKKQYLQYILAAIVIISSVLCVELKIKTLIRSQNMKGMPPMELGPGLPPMEFSKEMPPPVGYKVNNANLKPSIQLLFFQHIAIALLVLGSGTAYKVLLLWIKEEKEKKQLEENIKKSNMDVNEFIFVKADYKMVKIHIADIMYIESANEYIKIILDDGETITTFMRLKNMETMLPKEKFMRVQRSFIINLDKIQSVEKNRIFIEQKKSIPIGEQYKDRFQLYLGKNFIK